MALKFLRIMKVENEPGKPERVPGLIGPAWIRKVPLGEAKQLLSLEGLDGYVKVLELALCDEDGTQLSLKEIESIPFDATRALAAIASEWNGLSGESQQVMEKNSEPGPSEG